MYAIADIIFWTWIVLIVIQSNFTWKYMSALRSAWTRADVVATPSLKAAIILCLRGGDPFLKECIRALVQQDYPDYEVHIVVDSAEDPAWDIVTQTLGEVKTQVPVYVNPLKVKRETCSLKCSALLQAVSGLGDDIDAIALIDADTIANPSWLQELISPLADPTVGITTGIRWYAAVGTQWGTLNRYIWNAFAIVSMYFNQVPWGGTLGFRRDLIPDPVALWGNALCEDVPLRDAATGKGLSWQCVPALLSVNQEEATYPAFVRWASRQLLLTRLYHPNWKQMAFDIIFTPAITVLGMILFAIALLTQQFDVITHLGIGFTIFYICAGVIPMIAFDYSVRRVAATWGDPIPALPFLALVKLPFVFLSAYVSALLIVFPAMGARRMEWRGITYEIQDSHEVRLTEYFPYQPQPQTLNPNASI
jgi:cellulose synthase/poly-beta-1,6-N-acetylglucosamine synthase-like glycosyltransferase